MVDLCVASHVVGMAPTDTDSAFSALPDVPKQASAATIDLRRMGASIRYAPRGGCMEGGGPVDATV